MSSTTDIHHERATDRDALSGSANWDFDNGTHPTVRPGIAAPRRTRSCQWLWFPTRLLAVNSMTAVPDPWYETQHQRFQLTMRSTLQTSSRRRILRREALRLADDIMRRAEEGRMKAAEEEAHRQFDLESLM